jgi:ABC-type transport system involved in Fe-S cluster assembly fused permease/ATPase subunit
MSIINVEVMLWMWYKIDPFTMLQELTLNDMLFYVQTVTNRLEEERNANATQDKLMKSLVAIRDILNYMTFSQVSNN